MIGMDKSGPDVALPKAPINKAKGKFVVPGKDLFDSSSLEVRQ